MSLRDAMERARRAQIENRQGYDVQLDITAEDPTLDFSDPEWSNEEELANERKREMDEQWESLWRELNSVGPYSDRDPGDENDNQGGR